MIHQLMDKIGAATSALVGLHLAAVALSPGHAQGLEGSGEAWSKAIFHLNETSDLGAPEFGWSQLRLTGSGKVFHGPHLVGAAKVGALGHIGATYYGQAGSAQVRVLGLSLGGVGLMGGRLDVEAGRLSTRFGEGFLFADGSPNLPNPPDGSAPAGPWNVIRDDFNGARVSGESEGLLLEGVVARHPRSQGGGVILAGDGGWQLNVPGAFRGQGGVSLVALAREGAPRHMAGVRGSLGLGMGDLMGEVALQAGADEDVEGVTTPRLGASAYLRGRWDVVWSPLPAQVKGQVTFYSGDDPETERHEGWDPIFQADAFTGPFSQGVINPLLSGYNTDQITFTLGSGVAPRPGHEASIGGLLRMSHRGSAQCLALGLGPTCVIDSQGSLSSAGAFAPMLAELNLGYAFTQASEFGPLRHGAKLAIAAPLRGGRMTTLPTEGSPQALLEKGTSAALQLFSEARF